MMKAGIDQDALIAMFANASAKGSEQLRKGVSEATLAALQGRELTLKNIRSVLASVTQAASAGAAKNPVVGIDVEDLLEKAITGMDDALVKAVEANRLALQQFVDQGADLREKHLKKALSDLDKMEDTFIGTLKKSSAEASGQIAKQWAPLLDKMQVGSTMSGTQATAAVEQFASQMQTALRDTRAASMKAAQTLAESYAAMVSGVLVGMSDALKQGGVKAARKK